MKKFAIAIVLLICFAFPVWSQRRVIDTILYGGASLTSRSILNFTGNGITCTDDSANLRTNCNVTNYWTASGSDIYSNNTGNVGIGATAPNTKLNVVGGASGAERVLLELRSSATTTNTGTTLKFVNSTTPGAVHGAEIAAIRGSDGLTPIIFRNNNAAGNAMVEVMRISGTGNVGIGTPTPNSSLHIPDGRYAQLENNNAGAPPAADCDADAKRGRIALDRTNNRLYICMGATRGWDYVALTD